MKKSLSLIFIASFLAIGLFAQHRGMSDSDREKKMAEYKARRVAFLTREVGITPEEAANFFPIYDEMMVKKMQLFGRNKKSHYELLEKKGQRDEVYQNALSQLLNAPVEEANIDKEYYERFRSALSAEKLFRLKMAEGRFARSIMRNK